MSQQKNKIKQNKKGNLNLKESYYNTKATLI